MKALLLPVALFLPCVLLSPLHADEPAAGVSTTRGPARTLALPADEDVFQFVIYGDRTGGRPEGVRVLEQAVVDTNLLDPDLVMTVGDLVEGYNRTEQWMPQMEEFRRTMDRLTCPWFPVAGNHDVYWKRDDRKKPAGEHEASYEKHFGPLWYSFRHQNAGFVVLYTDEGDPLSGEKGFHEGRVQSMSPEQLEFLKAALQELKDADHVFVFMHHPRWIGGGYTGGNWDRVHRALADAGNVKAVFAGHIHHMRYDGVKDGIQYYALATTGGHLSQEIPGLGYLHHFNVVTVRKERVSVAAVPVGGVIDPKQFTAEFRNDAHAASYIRPRAANGSLQLGMDGAVDAIHEVTLKNPSKRTVTVTVEPDAGADWSVFPDHQHKTIESGQSVGMKFRFVRRGDDGLRDLSMPQFHSSVDYHGESVRVAVGKRVTPVDIAISATPEFFENASPGYLNLPGSRSAVRVESGALKLPQGAFTLESWVRLAKHPGGHRGMIAKTENSEFAIFLAQGVPQFDVHLNGRYVSAKAKQKLPLNEWVHVAGVFTGEQLQLYVNGQLAASKEGQGKRTRNQLPLYIGADPAGSGEPTRSFGGQLDEVRLSTMARYADSFAPQRRMVPDDQTAFLFHMDQTLGPYVLDASESHVTARLVNDAAIQADE